MSSLAGDRRPTRPLRRDAQQRRDALLSAVGTLLSAGCRDFPMSLLAERSGVSVATAYRNFPDTSTAIAAYVDRLTGDLLAAFDAIGPATDPLDEIAQICGVWVRRAASWGPAAVHLRSPEGILARRVAGEAFIGALYDRLSAVVDRAVRSGALPEQDVDYAVLAWVTILDERVVVDLTRTLGWPVERAADQLTGSVLAVLRQPRPPAPPPGSAGAPPRPSRSHRS